MNLIEGSKRGTAYLVVKFQVAVPRYICQFFSKFIWALMISAMSCLPVILG